MTTSIGVAGVTVGVAALITTLSVMNGFQTDIQNKIIGAQAHVTVYGLGGDEAKLAQAVAQDTQVQATAPFALGQAILTFEGHSVGAVIKGIEPSREFSVNDLGKTLREGSWNDLAPKVPSSGGKPVPGIVLGEELARNLGAWLGSYVVLVSPQSAASPIGLLPKMQKFRVAGLLHTGYYEYDSSMAYGGLDGVRKFLGTAAATGLSVRVKDLSQVDKTARRLRMLLGPGHSVRTYAQMNQTLYAALKLEKGVMFIILTLITLVASLNIASNLILRSVEKTRDIGLLKAMGASPKQIKRIFLAEGFLIGVSGLVAGMILGFVLCYIIAHFNIVELPADIYYISKVPVDIQAWDVAAVLGVGLLLSLLATVYPAARAAKVDPVEAIHYG